MIDHLEIESTVLHKDSEEAQAQMQREGANKIGKKNLTIHNKSWFQFKKLQKLLEQILQSKKTTTKKSGAVGSVVEGKSTECLV